MDHDVVMAEGGRRQPVGHHVCCWQSPVRYEELLTPDGWISPFIRCYSRCWVWILGEEMVGSRSTKRDAMTVGCYFLLPVTWKKKLSDLDTTLPDLDMTLSLKIMDCRR
ncbi:hypothetical protein ACLOJK_023928 [Asimina triloba]